jgi:hypothetical protein
VLLAIDGDGQQNGSECIAVAGVDSAVQAAKAFVKQHVPAVGDARKLLKEAQKDAKKTGRRVWIVISGPRCGPCFRLARWMEDQHALLAKDYVVLKLIGSVTKGSWELSNELNRPANAGIPWSRSHHERWSPGKYRFPLELRGLAALPRDARTHGPTVDRRRTGTDRAIALAARRVMPFYEKKGFGLAATVRTGTNPRRR